MESSSHLIKVLNGPHSGAQCAFMDGEDLLVGNSDGADVFLSDPHITPSHFRIRSDNGGYLITPVEGVVLIDGKRIPEAVTVKLGQVVTAGSTSLAIGPAGTLWPSLLIPDIKAVEALAEVTPEEAAPPPPKPAPPAKRGMIHGFLIASLAGVLLFSGWVLFAVGDEEKKPRMAYPGDTEKMRSDKVDEITVNKMNPIGERLATEIPGANTVIDKSRNNYQLRIFVRGEEQAKKARRMVGESGAGIFAEVVDLDEIDQILRDILKEQNLSINALAQSDGTVDFSGYIANKSEIDQLALEVATELPFLAQHYELILYGDQTADQINMMLESFNLAASVKATAANDGIHFVGSLQPSQQKAWEKAFSAINAKYGAALKEFDEVTFGGAGSAAPELQKLLGAPVVGITFGSSAWIELANGSRLFQGSSVGNGMTLQKISPTEIVFIGPQGSVCISPSSLSIRPPAAAPSTNNEK
jgi:type III secretion system YscD/HrpQ family protein